MPPRHVRLVDIVEAEDAGGRRLGLLHYRTLLPRWTGEAGLECEEGADEWRDPAGERLATADGVRFQSRRCRYVRVAEGRVAEE